MFPQRWIAKDTASRYRPPIFDCVIQGYAKIYRIYKYLQGLTRLYTRIYKDISNKYTRNWGRSLFGRQLCEEAMDIPNICHIWYAIALLRPVKSTQKSVAMDRTHISIHYQVLWKYCRTGHHNMLPGYYKNVGSGWESVLRLSDHLFDDGVALFQKPAQYFRIFITPS